MRSFNTLPAIVIAGAILAIAATVLYFIFIQPAKKAAKMPRFIRVIRDILEMKELYLEKVLRAMYIVSTLFCIIAGIMMIFSIRIPYIHDSIPEIRWNGGYGLLLLTCGPIVLRLMFEGAMMFIMLVKNTMQINNKIKAQEAEEPAEEPVAEQEKPGVVIVQSCE